MSLANVADAGDDVAWSSRPRRVLALPRLAVGAGVVPANGSPISVSIWDERSPPDFKIVE
jgi:hypothetical protein